MRFIIGAATLGKSWEGKHTRIVDTKSDLPVWSILSLCRENPFRPWVWKAMFTASAFVIEILSNISRKMMPTKPLVLFVLGGPGAGKGTQCANLVRVSPFLFSWFLYGCVMQVFYALFAVTWQLPTTLESKKEITDQYKQPMNTSLPKKYELGIYKWWWIYQLQVYIPNLKIS